MKNEKVINLAKKIKALAERGVGGEKENAIERLEFVMNKYGITSDDIEEVSKKSFDFELPKDIPMKFIRQVLASIIGSIGKYGCSIYTYKYVRKRNYISYEIEAIEPEFFSEFIIKVELFWNNYQKESQVFYDAYIQANELYVKPEESDSKEVYKELTPEEKARIMKIQFMAQSIDKVKYRKQLE